MSVHLGFTMTTNVSSLLYLKDSRAKTKNCSSSRRNSVVSDYDVMRLDLHLMLDSSGHLRQRDK